MKIITDANMRQQVIETLGADVEEYDINAIVDEIQAAHGRIDIDDLYADEY